MMLLAFIFEQPSYLTGTVSAVDLSENERWIEEVGIKHNNHFMLYLAVGSVHIKGKYTTLNPV